ncbi:YycC family protein [Cohnella sp. AR92]|uniref:YycC family protein n=1 Tax=Cohnella sp. AR92 TaxID=648716 RepID=UPI000F8F23A3|nr:YycC family protein [Cohnella sp. AR92]RUS48390.1 YycC family protein [Cohnella sp. AR92]
MRRMPLSTDTAVKLAKHLNVPLEHLMHMPQHILMQKLAEMAKAEQAAMQAEKNEDGAREKE